MIQRTLPKLALVLALITPVQFANAALARNVLQSCAFGAGAMAAATYIGLAPAINTGVLVLPVTEVIATNAMLGCGVGAAGATAATVIGWFYDAIF